MVTLHPQINVISCGNFQGSWLTSGKVPHQLQNTHPPRVVDIPLQLFHGPPSLTSSFAAAKIKSLLVLDVEIFDQPETEGATDFQIWMRLADSDSTEQIQHGQRMIAVRYS